jgi:hypothetical protein
MQSAAPTLRPPRTLTLGRGWLFPAAVLALILSSSYLPAHGVVGLPAIAAGTIAALGLIAASLAAPRLIRGSVLARSGAVALIGSEPAWEGEPAASARRRIAAVVLGAGLSAAGIAAFATLTFASDPATVRHAVMTVGLYANVALLLSNVIPVPPWPGWMLLVALIDRDGAPIDHRVNRAALIARGVIAIEAAAVGAVAIISTDLMLLVLAALLVWQGWMLTTVARADDVIQRFLTARRVGDLAQELSTTAGPNESTLVAAGRRTSERALIAVVDGDGFLGAIGPRQVAALPPSATQTPCRTAMVPLEHLELLRADAPATRALAQLSRHGFALVTGLPGLRYVEVGDLLQRIQLAAAIAQEARRTTRLSGNQKGTANDQNEMEDPR